MALQKIKKVQISEQVYEQLRSQIMDGAWKPGEKIPSESEMMAIFGVSRVTVRQAIQRLAGENLIETRRGEGSFVCSTDIDSFFRTSMPLLHLGAQEIREIFEFRTMFESGTARVAAEKMTPALIKKLEENYAGMLRSTDNTDAFVAHDLAFHKMLCEATGNTLANQIFQSYEPVLHQAIEGMIDVIGMDNGIKYHKLIIEALKEKDAKQVAESMVQHLQTNVDLFEHSPLSKN